MPLVVSLGKVMKEVLSSEINAFKPGWRVALSGPFRELISKLKLNLDGRPFYPSSESVFRVFKELDIADVKVIIVGQDPYPNEGHANGLAFAVNNNVRPLPRSLSNIFRAAGVDSQKRSGDLSAWVYQGVFLLNRILTVKPGIPGSHSGVGWEDFTDEVIRILNRDREGLVFMLWGVKAQTVEKLINSENIIS